MILLIKTLKLKRTDLRQALREAGEGIFFRRDYYININENNLAVYLMAALALDDFESAQDLLRQDTTMESIIKIAITMNEDTKMLSSHQFNLLLESIQSKDEIAAWLDKMGVRNYTINNDLTVDVDGDVYLNVRRLKSIPVKFNEVKGSYSCYNNQLTTLEGAPNEVGGDFNCFNNQLTTLEGAPNEVEGNFRCSINQLTTLEGAPNEVGGAFRCSYNQLTTLKGAPNKVGGDFSCHHNRLITLEGAPNEVGGGFYCSYNPLKSLDGKPDYVGGKFVIDHNVYDRLFPPDPNKVWTLDDIDEEPASEGVINIKDKIY